MSDFALLRDDALVTCTHELGRVALTVAQRWVTVDGVALLVRPDPEGRPIAGCPNLTVVTKPCTSTLAVGTGYSAFVTIDSRPVVRDDLVGMTDGQGGVYRYVCRDPRQRFVVEVTS